MLSLRELQQGFMQGVLYEDHATVAPEIRAHGFSAAERLGIYQNNCREAFLTALTAGYPVLQRLTGEAYFARLIRDYQEQHPSPSGNLHHAGSRLPAYLDHRFIGTQFEYFSHVARLEWACQEVLIAADAAPLEVAGLADVPPEFYPRLRFGLHPAVRLVSSPYPVFTIWEAHQQEAEPELIDLAAGGEQALVRRREEGIAIYRLTSAEFSALAALRSARPLGRVVDDAVALDGAFDLGAALQRWAALGIIVCFSVAGETEDAQGDFL